MVRTILIFQTRQNRFKRDYIQKQCAKWTRCASCGIVAKQNNHCTSKSSAPESPRRTSIRVALASKEFSTNSLTHALAEFGSWVWNDTVKSHLTCFKFPMVFGATKHAWRVTTTWFVQISCTTGFASLKHRTTSGTMLHYVALSQLNQEKPLQLQSAPVHCTIPGTLCFQKRTYTYQMLFFVTGNQPTNQDVGWIRNKRLWTGLTSVARLQLFFTMFP